MLKNIKLLFFNILFFAILLEVTSFVLIHYFQKAPYPEAYIKTKPFTVADYNESFGVWHPANVTTKSYGPCWNVEYSFNDVGARDKNRTYDTQNSRFLLIGDSYFEGYGVKASSRVPNILEKETGHEFLSFGTSGNFGTTQMSLMYDTLASKFDHDYLIVSFFPGNDFMDDDWDVCKNLDQYKNRYRPYYIKDSLGNYQLEYHVKQLEDSEWYFKKFSKKTIATQFNEIWQSDVSFKEKLNYFHKAFFFSRSLVGYYLRSLAYKKSSEYQNLESTVFQKLNSQQLNRFEYVLKRIQNKAKGRKLILLTIAHPLDYIQFEKSKKNSLGNRINSLCKSLDIKHIDLLKELSSYKERQNLFLPCDGHWSAKGNEVVANILHKKLKGWGYLD